MQLDKRDHYIALVLAPMLVCMLIWCAYTWHEKIFALIQKSVSPSSYYEISHGDFYFILLGITTGVAIYCLLISIHLFSCSGTLPESLPVQYRKQWDRLVGSHFIVALVLGVASVVGVHAWINNTNSIVASQMSGVDWDVFLGHTIQFLLSCGGLGFYLALFFYGHLSKNYKRRILSKSSDGR